MSQQGVAQSVIPHSDAGCTINGINGVGMISDDVTESDLITKYLPSGCIIMACNAANCCFCVLSLLSKHCHGSLGQCTRFSIVLLSLKTRLCASIFLRTLLSCGVFVILFSGMKPDGYRLSTSFIDTSHFAVCQLLRTLWVHVVLRVTPTLNATGVYRTDRNRSQ